jgi:hypothetical protein
MKTMSDWLSRAAALVLEVAGRTPERWTVPVAEKEPRVPCLIGEKIWQDRWGR